MLGFPSVRFWGCCCALLFLFLLSSLNVLVVTGEETCSTDGTCDTNLDKIAEAKVKIEQETEQETEEETEEIEIDHGVICGDGHGQCSEWASSGECDVNPRYMKKVCRLSCGTCLKDTKVDLGVEQNFDREHETKQMQIIEEAESYIRRIAQNKVDRLCLPFCKNKNASCSFWSAIGECEANKEWMQKNCGPVCRNCHEMLMEYRCPLDPETMPDTWKAGDLEEMFTNLTTLSEFRLYKPRILSRPSNEERDIPESAHSEESNEQYQKGPWVVVLDEFLKDDECDRLIAIGHKQGYERSSDVGTLQEDGSFSSNVNSGRTSTNAWCHQDCQNDVLVQGVIRRISHITNTPAPNSESLQLLRYEVGQFYRQHHDYIGQDLYRQQGPRILTVFLYLNNVTEGGATGFPLLNITVQPKKGSALVWPSVLNSDPTKKDGRTEHEALKVEEGLKFGANAWIHLRDFQTPHSKGCH